MDTVRLVGVRDRALSVDEVLRALVDPGAGGTCVFVGTVRDTDASRTVAALGYSAHPSVEVTLRALAEQVAADFPVLGVAAVHRVGELAVGDLAVVVAVCAAHRGEAFTACRQFVDELKATVPIWKHQRFADGDEEWVGAG